MSSKQMEIEHLDHLISIAKYDGITNVLEQYKKRLVKQAEISKPTNIATAEESTSNEQVLPNGKDLEGDKNVSKCSDPVPATAPCLGLAYVPIESFAWDQGEHNSPIVSVYIDLPSVGTVKDNVKCAFTSQSFDLTVVDLNGKNYRLVKDNLEKDIIPDESKCIVKKDRIVIKLKKVKGEYSYEHWSKLASNKPRQDRDIKKKDPSAGLMDMMKDMYDEGDDNMRKVIGEAMLKSQQERAQKGMM
mmetsp:Transcript_3129/g.3296  ORF Transcript_3129/g.3296 Transcript_3129/m.3296 type:complete len:245 (+) Transcript_3129:112-846(+)|eukprot:CAMPEP_0182427846 /NCGR_PEP_ID=MMETSP1167-20130531/20238_1 /TAXON_ID=2988 /ORGANISM="Mallomonas Sp, Strain CCMP3275" /LENGTH=244 /DNA_ID=CAMNT_0024610387 /DNA_START=84 /DNA_END=818 /DNA_ORIENTATION=+